jgi:N-methylhydantoinase A
MSRRIRIGVDVGGTFTDLVLVDDDVGRVVTGKRLTTPGDPSIAIIEGLERLLQEAGVAAGDVHGVVHGTTLVTNTVIERTGALVGLITTEGFRDVLEMGKEIRYDLYDLFMEPAPTLVPRSLRREVSERIDADGNVLRNIDLQGLEHTARELVEDEGVEALAVSFIHAYRNPEHEIAAGALLDRLFPHIPHTLSSRVAPEIREFERTSTACANAYVQPMMQGYLSTLERRLQEMGVHGTLYVMLSSGGLASLEQARRYPIQLIESGPAAGAMAASHYARLTGCNDLISFDMGGTTAKMCLIEDCRPQRTYEFEAGRVRRFKKGSGIPLKVSVVDMIEIGAGGGSIAAMDTMGLLKVGPRSAGSEPGPICYGRGGESATVTDADLMLGCLNPDYFLGGEMPLDAGALAAAVSSQLADPLGLTPLQAAAGIQRVVNENMAAATRRYLAEKGKDPRRYALIAFGGAGPVHADGLARLLKLRHVIVPFGAGVTSALGFLVAPPSVDHVRSQVMHLDDLDWSRINALYREMQAEAVAQLVQVGAIPEEIRFERHADMRHVGQGFEIPVPLPQPVAGSGDAEWALGPEQLPALREAFSSTYQRLFERRVDDVGVEAMTWRLSASAPAPHLELRFDAAARDAAGTGPARKGERPVQFPSGTVTAQVWDRYALAPGDRLEGPAVVEERESTTVMGPGARAWVDEALNLRIDLDPG